MVILQGEKCKFSVQAVEQEFPKGLKQKWKILEGRGGGVSDFGIWRARGDEYFGISEGKGGGLKCSCHPW